MELDSDKGYLEQRSDSSVAGPVDLLELQSHLVKNVASELSKPQIDDIITDVKVQFKYLLFSREKLIKLLGYAYEKFLSRKEDVCEEIKNVLEEEIADHLISRRQIERYCPDEWKKKTKPKRRIGNDKMSFPVAAEAENKNIVKQKLYTSSSSYNKRQTIAPDNEQCVSVGTDDDDLGTSSSDINHNLDSSNAQRSKEMVIQFSYVIPFKELLSQMQKIFKITRGKGDVWVYGMLDEASSKLVDFHLSSAEPSERKI